MKKRLLIILITLAPLTVICQQDYMIDQYMFNGLYLNPAYAGSHDYFNTSALFRTQWVSFEGSPMSELFSIDGPISDKNMGLGLLLANDNIGVTTQSDAYANYSYSLKLGERAKLAFGLKAGATFFKAKYSDHVYWDEGDEMLVSDQKHWMPNFGTGIYFYSDRIYAGVSVPHLLNYKPETFLTLDNNSYQLERHYYFTAGGGIDIGESFLLKPSLLLKYVPNAPLQGDISVSGLIGELVWVGFTYRTNASIMGIVQVQINNQFRLGYAYDRPTTDLRHFSSGSHEVMIAYMFMMKKEKAFMPSFF